MNGVFKVTVKISTILARRWNLTGGASHKKYDPDMEKLIALLCGQCSGDR
jgi:hypothetical protein